MKILVLILLFSAQAFACPNFEGKFTVELFGSLTQTYDFHQTGCEKISGLITQVEEGKTTTFDVMRVADGIYRVNPELTGPNSIMASNFENESFVSNVVKGFGSQNGVKYFTYQERWSLDSNQNLIVRIKKYDQQGNLLKNYAWLALRQP